MCKDCGCGQAGAVKAGTGHSHAHGHDHEHHHDHEHEHEHGHAHHHHHHEHDHNARTVELAQKVLAKNEVFARANREYFESAGVFTLNFISSPGSGKTLLLEKLLERLNGKVGCAVIVGDQQTDLDARRLSGKGAHVKQIETGHTCHLDAQRVHSALDLVIRGGTRLLLIENVGNLICPAAFALGEDEQVALLSITEGEDKPLKYPVVFAGADTIILTKADLAPHVEWNKDACLENLKRVAPRARIFITAAKTGEGLDELESFLIEKSLNKHQAE